jgi:hypothetical protein
MPKFESVHDAGDGGEDACGRVAEEEGCCEDAESLRDVSAARGRVSLRRGKMFGRGIRLKSGREALHRR